MCSVVVAQRLFVRQDGFVTRCHAVTLSPWNTAQFARQRHSLSMALFNTAIQIHSIPRNQIRFLQSMSKSKVDDGWSQVVALPVVILTETLHALNCLLHNTPVTESLFESTAERARWVWRPYTLTGKKCPRRKQTMAIRKAFWMFVRMV